MSRRLPGMAWAKLFERSLKSATRGTLRAGVRAAAKALAPALKPASWAAKTRSSAEISGIALGAAGARQFRLYRPPDIRPGERLPLLVMLHGCGQNAQVFAASTRMNLIAARERFLVLYPEQDRLSNLQGCWNWFETDSGRAYGEALLILSAIDQVCSLYPADVDRVAVAGLSAGASMAALLATRHPERFRAVAMHSGVPPGHAHSTRSAFDAMHGRQPAAMPVPASESVTWPPLLVIHGTNDRVVSRSNALAAVEAWSAAGGARPTAPRIVQRGKRHPATVTDYKHGARIVATLVEIAHLGHAWSGGAASQEYGDARGPDASRWIWGFVSSCLAFREA